MNHTDKLTIVINGRGGVGKDTLCDFAAEHFRVRNVSSVTPIKEIARAHGWNGEKDLRSRKFLSDLKRVFTEYNDLPTRYLTKEYREFCESDEQIMFVHIRESEQIAAFVRAVEGNCVTLLVRRNLDQPIANYGNVSDDEVEKFTYDYYYDNSVSLEETAQRFPAFLKAIADEKGIILN